MNSDDQKRLYHLFGAQADGTLTETEQRELQERLRSDAEARNAWFLHNDIEQGLHTLAGVQSALASVASPRPDSQSKSALWRWLQWRYIATASAGVVLGLFGGPLLLAYAIPGYSTSPARVVSLFEDGFESAAQPGVKGVPLEKGVWGGDRARVVTQASGTTPRSGTRMLQLLRSDFEGEKSTVSYSCDQVQVIDLRQHQAMIDADNAVVVASAWLRMMAPSRGEAFSVGVSISAFNADPTQFHGRDWATWQDAERLGFTKAQLPLAAGDYARWLPATCQFRLPRGTRYVNIHVWVRRREPAPTETPVDFSGAFVDDVSVRLVDYGNPAVLLARTSR